MGRVRVRLSVGRQVRLKLDEEIDQTGSPRPETRDKAIGYLERALIAIGELRGKGMRREAHLTERNAEEVMKRI